MRSQFEGRSGLGFVTGDGTLVVTAHHLVFEGSEQGEHEMAGMVIVVSPYLGEAAPAEIVASDEPLDLAILKVPWKGHPALSIADDNDVLSAEQMTVLGIPTTIQSLSADSNEPLPDNLDMRRETLPVDFAAVSEHNLRFIQLAESGKLGKGWSGSPILLPDSSSAAACFTSLRKTAIDKFKYTRPAATGPATANKKQENPVTFRPIWRLVNTQSHKKG